MEARRTAVADALQTLHRTLTAQQRRALVDAVAKRMQDHGPKGMAHAGKGRFAVLDRTRTHGGAMCAYNHKRQSLRCTSLNHAEYDLHGTLLHGRTHGNLREYVARVRGDRLEIEWEPKS